MREILVCGDPILRKKAALVKSINNDIHDLIGEMVTAMKRANGIGIAAPQIGESIQLAIVEIPRDMGGNGRVFLINPKIVGAYGGEVAEEGCLSVPGIQAKVKRYSEVTIETLNMEGHPVIFKGKGLLARAIQHEIDHLNGVLIIDKVTPFRRMLLKRKMKQLEKNRALKKSQNAPNRKGLN